MSRSSEAAMQQDDRENESGIDMHDCYHACHPLERNEFNEKTELQPKRLNQIVPLHRANH